MIQEVIVFAHAAHARHAGFRGPYNQHVHDDRIRAAWPGQDLDSWRGLQIERVTVTDHAIRYAHGNGTQAIQDLAALLAILRERLRCGRRLWIEL